MFSKDSKSPTQVAAATFVRAALAAVAAAVRLPSPGSRTAVLLTDWYIVTIPIFTLEIRSLQQHMGGVKFCILHSQD